jgi:hypothetical protein
VGRVDVSNSPAQALIVGGNEHISEDKLALLRVWLMALMRRGRIVPFGRQYLPSRPECVLKVDTNLSSINCTGSLSGCLR